METSTEAPASVTYSLISPNGYPVLFTVRDDSGKSLLDKMTTIETTLKDRGYLPQEKKSFGQKQVDYVPDRKCPKCGNQLVYATNSKTGEKFIKCSTNKWNKMLNKAEGCLFVEWPEKK